MRRMRVGDVGVFPPRRSCKLGLPRRTPLSRSAAIPAVEAGEDLGRQIPTQNGLAIHRSPQPSPFVTDAHVPVPASPQEPTVLVCSSGHVSPVPVSFTSVRRGGMLCVAVSEGLGIVAATSQVQKGIQGEDRVKIREMLSL